MANALSSDESEIWKDVVGWGEYYAVSSFGRVLSKARTIHFIGRGGRPVSRPMPERIMRPTAGPYGYCRVALQRDGKVTQSLVHRLVCEAFHGPCPADKEHCAHSDGNSSNNRADNLRWATARENGLDRIRLGQGPRGERVHNAVLTATAVREIRRRHAAGDGTNALAREFGVAAPTVSNVVTRKHWRHI